MTLPSGVPLSSLSGGNGVNMDEAGQWVSKIST